MRMAEYMDQNEKIYKSLAHIRHIYSQLSADELRLRAEFWAKSVLFWTKECEFWQFMDERLRLDCEANKVETQIIYNLIIRILNSDKYIQTTKGLTLDSIRDIQMNAENQWIHVMTNSSEEEFMPELVFSCQTPQQDIIYSDELRHVDAYLFGTEAYVEPIYRTDTTVSGNENEQAHYDDITMNNPDHNYFKATDPVFNGKINNKMVSAANCRLTRSAAKRGLCLNESEIQVNNTKRGKLIENITEIVLDEQYYSRSPSATPLGEYAIDRIVSIETIDGQIYFGVKWCSLSDEFNTLELIENVVNCRPFRVFAANYVDLGMGANTQAYAKRTGRPCNANHTWKADAYHNLTSVTKQADIPRGDNDYQIIANKYLRQYVSERKYCCRLGFYSNKADNKYKVVANEIDFVINIGKEWNRLSADSYHIVDAFIGHPFQTVDKLRQFRHLYPQHRGAHLTHPTGAVKRLCKAMKQCTGGVVCLVVGPGGRRHSVAATDVYSRVFVMVGKARHRVCYYFDPLPKERDPNPLVIEIKNKMARNTRILCANGRSDGAGGRECIRTLWTEREHKSSHKT
ncbi:unnamed protein product [Medioppia subpectinata]|uniref:Chromo domain-containing protein n=1 Tax=Medioppia subpectinata TaxID=1979941 RepID=A0A7R9KPE5_9ACAR|nr:unnamed protein product [Medioppia subpectinata]CAG2105958.1 unnamed protein product [Medioppia subpectinata]